MGLLDALFDQGSYGGQGGGLLDLIRGGLSSNDPPRDSRGFPPPGYRDPRVSVDMQYIGSTPRVLDNNEPSPLDIARWPAGPQGMPRDAPASFMSRFNAIPNAPQQFTPSGRSFDSAQFDPQTFAPNQAQPIAVGSNYQMPRIGGADQYQPQQAMLPPNAQPAQGQLPQQAPPAPPSQAQQPEQPLPPAFGGGSIFSRIGNPDGLIARLTGNDSRSLAQQNLTAQYNSLRQALIANGETPQAASSKAMVAAMNPEAAKTIIPELFTNKEKYGVVSEDPFAGKKYGFINERDQTVNGKRVDAQGAAAASPLVEMESAKARGVQGEALYEYLPKQIAPMVKAMIEGRQPLPTGAAMRNPATLALIDAAHSVDPTFDATSWGARVKGQADYYGGGKSSEIMRKANQSALHFGELVSDKMAELPGHDMPAVNAAANFVNTNLLGKGAQGNFEVNAHALADELAGLFKGANLSDTEIRAWESKLTPNMSVEQQRGMAKTLLGLYRDSVTALEKKRVESIGQAAADRKGPILGPEADAALSGVEKFANGGTRGAPISAKPTLPSGWSVKVN